MIFWYIILFIFILGLLICFHEAGHFYFAKRAGILCHEFSFGMGPLIWHKKKGETTYSIRAIPIGGYVAMAGELEEESIIKIGQIIKLTLNENGRVTGIVLDHKNPKYTELPEITVEKFDLLGKDGNDLYINDYIVNRDALAIYNNTELQIAPFDRLYSSKSLWKRTKTVVAGPLANILLAILVFITLGLIMGVADKNNTTVAKVDKDSLVYDYLLEGDKIIAVNGEKVETWDEITEEVRKNGLTRVHTFTVLRDGKEVVLDKIVYQYTFVGFGFSSSKTGDFDKVIISNTLVSSPTGDKKTNAYLAGLRDGDEILSVNGTEIKNWGDLADYANNFTQGGEATVIVKRGTEEVTVKYIKETAYVYGSQVIEAQGLTDANGKAILFVSQLGISMPTKFSLGKGIVNGLTLTIEAEKSIFKTLGALFSSDQVGVSDLGGPLGIFDMTATYASQGLESTLQFIGLLSVNLGIVNLLPIPALDGGRLVFIIYEAITKKKAPKKLENILISVTFVALMVFFVYVTYNDIVRLFFK